MNFAAFNAKLMNINGEYENIQCTISKIFTVAITDFDWNTRFDYGARLVFSLRMDRCGKIVGKKTPNNKNNCKNYSYRSRNNNNITEAPATTTTKEYRKKHHIRRSLKQKLSIYISISVHFSTCTQFSMVYSENALSKIKLMNYVKNITTVCIHLDAAFF